MAWCFSTSASVATVLSMHSSLSQHLRVKTRALIQYKDVILPSAEDKPKFMGRPPYHPWWKTGSPKSFLGRPNCFDLSLKDICFLVINTKLACFPFNHVPTYRELGRPSGDFEGHVGSPDRVMGRIWRLSNRLSTALFTSIGNPIVEIRQLWDHLISKMGFPTLARWHLYIKSALKMQR